MDHRSDTGDSLGDVVGIGERDTVPGARSEVRAGPAASLVIGHSASAQATHRYGMPGPVVADTSTSTSAVAMVEQP